VCLVLVCSDFNPHLYLSVSHALFSRFTETSSPVTMLEVFLKLMTHGQCHSVDNGTISTLDYDVKHWALSQSKVKGLHSSFWMAWWHSRFSIEGHLIKLGMWMCMHV